MDPKLPLAPNIIDALKRGNQVEAIKLLRQAAKGMGLAEAKAALDQLRQAAAAEQARTAHAARPGNPGKTTMAHRHVAQPHMPRHPGLSPGEVPRSSGGAGALVVLAIGVLAAWYYLH